MSAAGWPLPSAPSLRAGPALRIGAWSLAWDHGWSHGGVVLGPPVVPTPR